jgi:hypothetical protein
MKIQVTDRNETHSYQFVVNRKKTSYVVDVWTKANGRFTDWEVRNKKTGALASQAVEDEIIEEIDKQWSSLV